MKLGVLRKGAQHTQGVGLLTVTRDLKYKSRRFVNEEASVVLPELVIGASRAIAWVENHTGIGLESQTR